MVNRQAQPTRPEVDRMVEADDQLPPDLQTPMKRTRTLDSCTPTTQAKKIQTKKDQQQSQTSVKPNKTKIRVIIITCLVTICVAISIALGLVQHQHFRDSLTANQISNYTLPNEDRYISSTLFEYVHKYWFSSNQKIEGQFMNLPSNKQNTAIPSLIALNNPQTGITLKWLNKGQYIIQVDPARFMAYYQKTYPIETKRMLTYLQLTRNLAADETSFASEQLQRKIVQNICSQTRMDVNSTILKQVSYHIATNTNEGFVLQKKKPISSRLLPYAQHRQLFFYDMYMAYMMASRTSQMVDTAEQILKAQQKQQKEKEQQPVTVITVINIINNTNVVINLNSSSNVVINNNNNKEVNIVKGNNEPVINNNSQVQSNTNRKRMLTVEANEVKSEVDGRSDISKAAFEYAALCSEIDGDKYCPAGYFHRANNPFKLAAGQYEKGVSDVKQVKRILIGSQILLNLDRVLEQAKSAGNN